MEERLHKTLSARGCTSRRAAEEMIRTGRVLVNGVPAVTGQKANPERDIILVDGHPLPKQAERIYIMLNKPIGYVTTLRDQNGRKDVTLLVKEVNTRIYPVGRLDINSEGLLLMTNDGDFASRIQHPSHEVKKEYHVTVSGQELEKGIEILSSPLVIDGYKIKPAKVFLLKTDKDRALLSVTIHEGRNRQVRKMCEIAGFSVLRLRRIAVGGLKLGNLKPGTWRHLSPEEILLFGV